jgi:putative endonuclease
LHLDVRLSFAAHLTLGEQGESLAVRALERAGYAVLARRYRTRLGEIDIIARDGPCLVFVEVKTRQHHRCGRPDEQITVRKQRKIVAIARLFLARTQVRADACRFDVVSVSMDDGWPQVNIIRNAFDAGIT